MIRVRAQLLYIIESNDNSVRMYPGEGPFESAEDAWQCIADKICFEAGRSQAAETDAEYDRLFKLQKRLARWLWYMYEGRHERV